ncbi:hypothetical protein AAMO2058_001745000 [Amorphochlora amoebiformis]
MFAYTPEEDDDFGHAHLIKLVLIGDSGVGKTSLLSRFVDNEFSDHYFSTIGVDFKARRMRIGDSKVKVQIWDTAGQERFRTITSSYYRGAKGIMVVYNVADKLSFENANSWLVEAGKYADPSTIKLLVGNKADLPASKRKVSYEEAQEFSEKYNLAWIETSARAGTNVEKAFEILCGQILKAQGTEPSSLGSPDGTAVKLKQENKSLKRQRCC